MSNNTALSGLGNIALSWGEQYVLNAAAKQITILVAADEQRFPADSLAALSLQVDGDLAHATRKALGVLGFLVDAFWNNSTLQGILTGLITSAIESSAKPPAS